MSVNHVELHPQFLVDEQGQRQAVQLSVKEFDALVELVDDYLDGLALDRAVDTAIEFSDLSDVVARLKAKGKL